MADERHGILAYRPDYKEDAMKLSEAAFAIPAVLALMAWAGSHFEAAASPDAVRVPGYADVENCTPVRPEHVAQQKARTVSFAFLIGEDGEVRDTKMTKSSGHQELDQAALAAFQHCTFHPQMYRGQARLSWVMLNYRWEPVRD